MITEPTVETVDCTFCDEPIVPEVEDGDTAFDCKCCGNGWHHFDCASACSAYLDDLNAERILDAAMDARFDQ